MRLAAPGRRQGGADLGLWESREGPAPGGTHGGWMRSLPVAPYVSQTPGPAPLRCPCLNGLPEHRMLVGIPCPQNFRACRPPRRHSETPGAGASPGPEAVGAQEGTWPHSQGPNLGPGSSLLSVGAPAGPRTPSSEREDPSLPAAASPGQTAGGIRGGQPGPRPRTPRRCGQPLRASPEGGRHGAAAVACPRFPFNLLF